MGIFDFFKSKKEIPEDLEAVFTKAANDNSMRPLFYRTLIKSDLIILTIKNEEPSESKETSDESTTIQVRALEEGIIPVFTSSDRIFDNNVINEQTCYAKLNAKVIFEMFPEGTVFVLNPYSKVSKELLPNEIKSLVSNELYKPSDIFKVKSGEIILLGEPADYPINLVEALKRYFDTRKEIKGAYLALIDIKSDNTKPHFLLGLDIPRGNLKEIFGEACEIAKPYLEKDQPIDMLNTAEKGSIVSLLQKEKYKIYGQKDWFD